MAFDQPDVWMTLTPKTVDLLDRARTNKGSLGQFVALLKERADLINEELSLSRAEYAVVFEEAQYWQHGYQDLFQAIVRCAERCS